MSKMMDRHRARKASLVQGGGSTPNTVTPRIAANTTPVAPRKTAGTSKGRYVTLVQTPGNLLEIIPQPIALATWAQDNLHHLPTDTLIAINTPSAQEELAKAEKNNGRRYDVWGDEATLHELLDDLTSNGWHWVGPEEIGALTSAPILEAPDGRLYWHERYQVESAVDDLLIGKSVKFLGADENRAPKEVLPTPEPGIKAAAWDESGAGVGEPSAKPCNDFEGQAKPGGVCHNCRNDYSKHSESRKRTAGAKKADAALDTPIAPLTPPEPLPTPGGNPYKGWQTDNLIESIETLTDNDAFATTKPEQKAVEQMAEVLSARPVEKPATEAAKAACLKKVHTAFGGSFFVSNDETGNILEGDRSIPSGHDHQDDNTGIVRPKTDNPSKFAGQKKADGFTPENEETGDVLEGDKSVAATPAEEDHTGVSLPSTEIPSKFAAVAPSKYKCPECSGTVRTYKGSGGPCLTSHDVDGKECPGTNKEVTGLEKVATGFPPENQDTAKVLEGDHSVGQTPADENHTGVTAPSTETPTKVAGVPLSTVKALKLVADLADELQALYMDAKPITTVNDSRPVREAVEAIYHAQQAMGGAQKVLAKQQQIEKEEVERLDAVGKAKKKSSLLSVANLVMAAAEEEEDEGEGEGEKTASTRVSRQEFRSLVASVAAEGKKLASETATEVGDAMIRVSSAYRRSTSAKQAGLQKRMSALAEQTGFSVVFDGGQILITAGDKTVPVPAL